MVLGKGAFFSVWCTLLIDDAGAHLAASVQMQWQFLDFVRYRWLLDLRNALVICAHMRLWGGSRYV